MRKLITLFAVTSTILIFGHAFSISQAQKKEEGLEQGNVQDMVSKLGQALSGSPIDPKAVESLFQAIGTENCFKCHLVHLPAAYAKY